MNEFVARRPIWSLIIAVLVIAAIWLVFAPWSSGFEAIFGRKKLFLNAVLNGITLGGLYFLVASGFTLIFGLMRNVNLAHGSIYLLGGYFGYLAVDATGSWLFGFVVAFVVAALLGVILQVAVFRRMEGQDLRQTLVTLGISIVLADLMLMGFRREFVADSNPDMASRADGASADHRGQVLGRGGLSVLSDRSPGHLLGLGRDWPRDVARPEPHPDRHDRSRRRRRPRYAVGDGRADPACLRDRIRLRRWACRNGRRGRRELSNRCLRAKTRAFCLPL